jgi:hypothetical protein
MTKSVLHERIDWLMPTTLRSFGSFAVTKSFSLARMRKGDVVRVFPRCRRMPVTVTSVVLLMDSWTSKGSTTR